MKLLYFYLVAVNLLAFLLMGLDKRRAVRHRWRIPEKTLFFFPLLGGAAGGLIGMLFFHHKTLHKKFSVGFPLLLLLWAALLYYLFTTLLPVR